MKLEQIPSFKLAYQQDEHAEEFESLHIEPLQERSALHNWQIKPHRHDQLLQIFSLATGSVQATIDGQTFDLIAPQVIAIPALCVHGFHFQDDTTGFVLSAFNHEIRDALSTLPKTAPMFQQPLITQAGKVSTELDLLQRNIQTFHQEFKNIQRGRPSYLRALLKIILIELSRLSDYQRDYSSVKLKSNTEQFSELNRLIEEHFKESKSADFYAQKLNMSPSKLTKLCMSLVKQTPHAMITNKLILEAKRYLIYTSMSLAQITEALGMKDPAYFSRLFKKHCGMTPNQFRKNPKSL